MEDHGLIFSQNVAHFILPDDSQAQERCHFFIIINFFLFQFRNLGGSKCGMLLFLWNGCFYACTGGIFYFLNMIVEIFTGEPGIHVSYL